jgi:hypothetical protein
MEAAVSKRGAQELRQDGRVSRRRSYPYGRVI